MKKNYLILFFLILLTATVFTSCSDDDENDENNKKAWYDNSPIIKNLRLTVEENEYSGDIFTAEKTEYFIRNQEGKKPSLEGIRIKFYKVFNTDGLLEKETMSYPDDSINSVNHILTEKTYSYEGKRLVELKEINYSNDNNKTSYIKYKFAYDDAKKAVTVWKYKKDYDDSESFIEKKIFYYKEGKLDYTEFFNKVETKELLDTFSKRIVVQKDHKKNITLAYYCSEHKSPASEQVSDEGWDGYYTENFTYHDGTESKDIENDDITERPDFVTTKADGYYIDDNNVRLNGNVKIATAIYYYGNWKAVSEVKENQIVSKYIWSFDNRGILSCEEYYRLYDEKGLLLNTRTNYKYNTKNDKRLTEKSGLEYHNGNLATTSKITITYNDEKKNATVRYFSASGENELTEYSNYNVFALTKDGFVNDFIFENHNYYNPTKSLNNTEDSSYKDPYKTVHEKKNVTNQGNKTIYELYQEIVNYNNDGSIEQNREIENYRKIIVEYY